MNSGRSPSQKLRRKRLHLDGRWHFYTKGEEFGHVRKGNFMLMKVHTKLAQQDEIRKGFEIV